MTDSLRDLSSVTATSHVRLLSPGRSSRDRGTKTLPCISFPVVYM